jgi:putative hemolysin
VPQSIASAIGILTVSAIYITVTVILIAIVARHMALKKPLKNALKFSLFASVISGIFRPFSAFLSVCSKGILKLMGIDPAEQDTKTATEEAIKMLVDTGTERGTIDNEEKEFIENVFNFDDVDADEIATHRREITVLWLDETNAQWEKTINQSHHTYFLICDEKIDNVVGVLNSKEYFRLKSKSRENIMKYAVKSPFYIPSSMKANAVLKAMKQKRTYFAVVIDEYGGLSGILTVTDLLECIVGEIFEDSDAPKIPDIEPLDSKTWRILGQASIDEVAETLGVSLDGDYDTFAGYALTMLDSIPDDDEVLTVENDLMSIKITSVKDHRILKTVVKLKDTAAQENT